jgi:hypothetical protein
MIRSYISCSSSRKTALFLAFASFSLASFMILESVSTMSATFGQTGSLQSNSSNSKLSTINNENVIGDSFYTENTKSTNIKVLSIDPIPSVEVTYTGNSTMGGAPTQTIGTTVDKMNTDGTVSSKGQAIILTPAGQVITYRSESIGTYNPDGSFSNSGVMVFHLPLKTNSTDTFYTQFDNLVGIYKKTVDPEGNGLTKVWKWR